MVVVVAVYLVYAAMWRGGWCLMLLGLRCGGSGPHGCHAAPQYASRHGGKEAMIYTAATQVVRRQRAVSARYNTAGHSSSATAAACITARQASMVMAPNDT